MIRSLLQSMTETSHVPSEAVATVRTFVYCAAFASGDVNTSRRLHQAQQALIAFDDTLAADGIDPIRGRPPEPPPPEEGEDLK